MSLTELIAYCQANGIKGSYRVDHDPPHWRARVRVGQHIYSVPADTREESLEHTAAHALDCLRDPMPTKGTDAYAAWVRRRG